MKSKMRVSQLVANKVRHAFVTVQDKPATYKQVEVEVTTYDPPIVLHEASPPKDSGKLLFGFVDLRGRCYQVRRTGRRHLLVYNDGSNTLVLRKLAGREVKHFKEFSEAYGRSGPMRGDPIRYLEPIVATSDKRF